MTVDGQDNPQALAHEPHQQVESTFEPAPSSVPLARNFVLAIRWSDDSQANDRLALITSELVTNAVLHARTEIRVTVSSSPRRIRVSVADGSNAPPIVKSYGPLSPTGRGLHLVSDLADRWGSEVSGSGKTVWFELDRKSA